MTAAILEREKRPVLATAILAAAPRERHTARGSILVVALALADLGAVGVENTAIEIHARGTAAKMLKACAAGDNLAVAGVLTTERWTNRRGVSGKSTRLVIREMRVYRNAEVEP